MTNIVHFTYLYINPLLDTLTYIPNSQYDEMVNQLQHLKGIKMTHANPRPLLTKHVIVCG